MSKPATAALILALLLCFALTRAAARRAPVSSDATGVDSEQLEIEESCDGFRNDEECLKRRTLAAHTDYIYSQKVKP